MLVRSLMPKRASTNRDGTIRSFGQGAQNDDDRDRQLRRGLRLGMSRKGNCWDNAPIESLFSSMKTELGFELPPADVRGLPC